MWHFIGYQVRNSSQLHTYLIDAFPNDFLIFVFFLHQNLIFSSDEVIPPPPPPPAPPERKVTPSHPVAIPSATVTEPLLTRNLYKTLHSSFKPFSSAKKISHAQSTPDLSSLVSENKNDDDTSSSLENLSNTYVSKNLPEQRPAGSILKRRPKPSSKSSQINEEPIYVSSVSVPMQQSGIRSVQSMIREQNTSIPER